MTQSHKILWLAVFVATLVLLPGRAAAQWVYATSPNANVVSVIDPAHDTVARTILTPFSPGPIAVTPDGQHAYVVNDCSPADRTSGVPGSVTVLDLASNSVSTNISVGNCPNAIVVGTTPNGVRAYVANNSSSVSVIDVATNTVLPSITTPAPAVDVALTPDGTTLYVASRPDVAVDTASNTVTSLSVFDTFIAVDPFSVPWFTGGASVSDSSFSFFADCTSGPVVFAPGKAFILDVECNEIYDATTSAIVNRFAFNNFNFANLSNSVDRIAISSDGSRGYVAGQLVSSSFTNASATVVLSGGTVAAVNVTSPGSGYITGAPAVEILSRDQNANAQGQVDSTGAFCGVPGCIYGINFGFGPGAGGSGYSQPPAVQFVCTDSPGQCANATPPAAVATILNGSVASVTINRAGSGYIDSPLVVFIRQNYTPAAGFATVANGGVVSVTVTNPGSGYAQPPVVEFVCGVAPAACGAGVLSFNTGNDSEIATIPLVGATAQGVAVAPTPAPNTPVSNPAGTAVQVTPGNAPVTVTFESGVTQAGFTGALISTTGPSLQPDFQLSNPSVYYDIFTTAVYPAGSNIQVCITAQGVTNNSRLIHFVGGSPVDITNPLPPTLPSTPPTICGVTTSLSPFAIVEPVNSGATATVSSISFAPAASISYGTASTATVTVAPAGGAGTVSGNVTLSVDGGTATTVALSGGSAAFSLGVLGAGNHSLSANFGAQGSFLGSSANGTLTVAPAPLTLTADNKSKVYGAALPALTFTASGFVNGDTVASLTAQPALSTTAALGSGVGSYPITISGAVDANYSITYVPGTLSVTPATLTITATSVSKILDAPNPAPLPWTAAGFVNGDNTTVLTASPACTTTATTASPVGSYPITCSSAAAANYTFSYIAGTLKILYATAIGHLIQPPINADGSSVFHQGRTVPAKFTVYDANGVSIGTPDVVSSFLLTAIVSGTTTTTVEDVVDTNNPDTAFRWDGQEWIFNITTGNLPAGNTYIYTITLNDGSAIVFQYGLM
jgi:YVTN family beta-propeller protein